jgi:hypothetical protein
MSRQLLTMPNHADRFANSALLRHGTRPYPNLIGIKQVRSLKVLYT